jgi:hypothetical protein
LALIICVAGHIGFTKGDHYSTKAETLDEAVEIIKGKNFEQSKEKAIM